MTTRTLIPLALAALTVLLPACAKYKNSSSTAANSTATITVTRQGPDDTWAGPLYVSVNGVELGSVPQYGTFTFTYFPYSGDNFVELKIKEVGYGGQINNWTNSTTVQAWPGASYSLACWGSQAGLASVTPWVGIQNGTSAPAMPPLAPLTEAPPTTEGFKVQLLGTKRELVKEYVVTASRVVEQGDERGTTFDQKIEFARGNKTGGEIGVNYLALAGNVSTQLETQHGIKLEYGKKFSRWVKVLADKETEGRRVRIKWYALRQEGSIQVNAGLETKTIQFEYTLEMESEVEELR